MAKWRVCFVEKGKNEPTRVWADSERERSRIIQNAKKKGAEDFCWCSEKEVILECPLCIQTFGLPKHLKWLADRGLIKLPETAKKNSRGDSHEA